MIIRDIFKHTERETYLVLVDKKGRMVWNGMTMNVPEYLMEKWVDVIIPGSYETLHIKLDEEV